MAKKVAQAEGLKDGYRLGEWLLSVNLLLLHVIFFKPVILISNFKLRFSG